MVFLLQSSCALYHLTLPAPPPPTISQVLRADSSILGSKGSWGTLWGEEENTGSLVLENDLNRQEGEEGKTVLPEQQTRAETLGYRVTTPCRRR